MTNECKKKRTDFFHWFAEESNNKLKKQKTHIKGADTNIDLK